MFGVFGTVREFPRIVDVTGESVTVDAPEGEPIALGGMDCPVDGAMLHEGHHMFSCSHGRARAYVESEVVARQPGGWTRRVYRVWFNLIQS